jgi:hypothetical protein
MITKNAFLLLVLLATPQIFAVKPNRDISCINNISTMQQLRKLNSRHYDRKFCEFHNRRVCEKEWNNFTNKMCLAALAALVAAMFYQGYLFAIKEENHQ